jgi:hypothetical protein
MSRMGFIVDAGLAEGLSMIAVLALVILTPRESSTFWLSPAAFLLLLTMHAVYWIVTAPVNKIWLEEEKLARQVRLSSA